MKNILLVLILLIGSTTTSIYAQRTCNHDHHQQQLMQDPNYAQQHQQRQARFQNAMNESAERAQCANPVTLPMAVHFQGISNPNDTCLVALAQSQIQILNEDYGGFNADITNWTNTAAASFPGVSNGEACIAFCLATANHPTGYGLVEGQPAVTFNQFTGSSNSDFSGYINIFVRNIGALGFSPLGGSGNGDGVTIDESAFGSGSGCTGVVPGAPYNLGRTLTHELGHYLNLDHIWGGGCGSDDGVADTPDSQSSYGGCPTIGAASCSSTDMHMNYMDYTNDACMYMFSAGQAAVMETYVAQNLQNVSNNYATVCNVPTPTCTDGVQNGDETGIDCGGASCPACSTLCNDGVQNGDETGVDCGGSCAACSSAPCTVFNPNTTYLWDAGIPTACGVANATQTTYEAWTNESFIIQNVTPNQAYNYNYCNGYDANVWAGSLTVYSLSSDGSSYTIEELLGFAEGCSIDFTTTAFTDLFVYVNGLADACDAASLETDNGFYQLYCVVPSDDLYVDVSATGANDGSDWANAFTDLQDALAIGANKTIHVAEGTYKPTTGTVRGITFDIPGGAAVLGGYPAGGGTRNPDTEITILSGDIDNIPGYAGNSYHVVRLQNVTGITLDGLHVKDGSADDPNSFGRARGGGIYSTGSTATLNDVTIRRNRAIFGGGMFATLSPSIVFNDCEIKLNEAGNGSALYHSNETNMFINGCTIIDNNSTIRCAIEINNSLSTEINNSVIANNASQNANAIGFIATNRDQSCNIYNTTIIGETKDKYLISLQVGNNDVLTVNIYNTIIAHQTPSFTKNVVAYNNGTLNLATQNCYVQGSSIIGTTTNNLYENPSGNLMLNADYSVDECSPAVNAGNNANINGLTEDIEGNSRIFDTTVDIGAFEAQTSCSTPREDLSGNINIYPNPTTGLVNIKTDLETFNIHVFDMLGKKVAQSNTQEIDLSHLPLGVYMLNVENEGNIIFTDKVVRK